MYSLHDLPPQTILDFIISVNKAVDEHPDPASDEKLKENKRLADKLAADAIRHHRALQAETRRSAAAYRPKLEADQRREDARIEHRKPGDFSSRKLI